MGYNQGVYSPPAGLIVVVDYAGFISAVKDYASIDGIARISYISYLCVK
jgi:hypothetical protein